MFSKWTITAFLGVVITSGFFAIRSVQDYKEDKYIIGILKSIDHSALDATANGVITQLKKDLKNPKIIYESAQADNSLAQQIVQKFIQQKVDCIVTIGTTVTQVAQQKTRNIPIVFASVTDPLGSGIIKDLNNPGGNVTGMSNFAPDITAKQFEFYKKLLPNLKTIGVIYNSGENNSVILLEKIKSEAKKYSIEIKEVVIQNTNDAIFGVKSIIGSVDAILIDNDNTALGAIKGIVDVALRANLPVLCSDIDTIESGVLGAVGPDQYKLGERGGEMVVEIVRDKVEIGELPVMFATDVKYVVNEKTAQKLQIAIPDGAEIY